LTLEVFGLEGKTAIVTGGNSGLGKAIATALYEAGANVVICGRDKAKLDQTIEGINDDYRFKGIVADVREKSEVNKLLAFTVENFKSVNIMVNNAGIVYIKPALEYTEADWKSIWEINVMGVFYGCCAVANYWINNNMPGKIINISSVAGLRGYPGIYVGYSTTKAAVVNMTRALAIEWAPYRINVNCIAPGRFDTEMNRDRHSDPKELEKITRRIPLGRVGMPWEIGPLAVYLSSQASDFMTGEVILLDGGSFQV